MSATGPLEPASAQRQASRWLQMGIIWHMAAAIGLVVAPIVLWFGGDQALWVRLVATTLLLSLALGSLAAAFFLYRRQHRGRLLSLLVNYLGFLGTFIAAAHLLGVFDALDALADRFGRALPFLALAGAGYWLVTTARPSEPGQRPAGRRQAGRLILAAGVIAFVLRAGAFTGVSAVGRRLISPAPLSLVIAAILFAVFLFGLWRRPVADALGATNRDGEMINGFLFLSPNLLGFLIFIAGPLLLSLYVSFTNWDAFGTADWVGLSNYRTIVGLDLASLSEPTQRANEVLDIRVYDELTRFTLLGRSYVLGARDKLFWISLGNTLRFVLLAVPLSVVPALFLTNLLNSKVPGMHFFRAIYFLPSVAAVVGIALVWQWLFNSTVGYINYGITTGVAWLNQLGFDLVDPQVRWLSESRTALLAVVIMSAWQWTGFNTVLFLAGLQNVPHVLYEAATVDGANPRQQFWRITLPLLAPTTFFVLVTTTIQAMQIFEQVFILMPGQNPAGPDNATLTLVLYLYQRGFQRFDQGYASAIAWILFILIFGATLVQFQRQRASGAEDR